MKSAHALWGRLLSRVRPFWLHAPQGNSTEKNGVPPSTRAPVLFIHLGMNAKKHSIASCMKHKCRFKSSFTQFLHKSIGNKHA